MRKLLVFTLIACFAQTVIAAQFSISTVSPTAVSQNVQTQFNISAICGFGMTSCDFYWDGAWVSAMTRVSGTAQNGVWAANYTPAIAGAHYAWGNCTCGGSKAYTNTSITVTAPDTTPPSVSAVSPITVLNNTAVQFNITATDDVNVTGCALYWDGASQGAMTSVGGNVWAKNYTPTSSGAHYAWANCSDTAGNSNKTNTTITVNTLPYLYSQDYSGSADPSDYNANWGGNESIPGYEWASAVKIYVPSFTTGWILIGMNASTDSAVFKFNGTDTFVLSAGAYGEPGKYNLTNGTFYINVTSGDPGFAIVPPLAPGVGEGGSTAAAPESPLAALAIIGAAAIIGAFLILRRD
jgi:hypothetical protein